MRVLSCRFVVSVLGCFAIVSNDAIEAQIVPDNTVGSQIERVNATRERITGGTTRGSNLFHSFSEFSISEGRAAYFANPAAIRTIFSRVTGNNPSQIFGTLGVEGSANLFFINPNGIIFGPNATLDVRGSFIASTANSIAFPNGENFSATNPNAPPLLTIDVSVPIGLRFESDNSGQIFNAGDLQAGKHLALIGGRIASTGQISAPGQDITLATVPAGIDSIVRLEGTGQYIGQNTQGTGQPNVAGRDILLRGGKIDASSIRLISSAANNSFSFLSTSTLGKGKAGDLTINTRQLLLRDRAYISTLNGSESEENAGNLTINATESVRLMGATDGLTTSLNTDTLGRWSKHLYYYKQRRKCRKFDR
jgi:filamentous hemagglutinin family protein